MSWARYLVLAALAVTGCGGSQALRAAEAGNLVELRRELAAELKSGDLDEGEARDVALVIASTEVTGAKGSVGAQRIRSVAACARQLDEALTERSETRDEPGAAAAMVRTEAGLVDADDLAEQTDLARKPDGSLAGDWRAVGARSLVRAEDAALRRKLFADGDERVRLGALRAARQTRDVGDVDGLLEAARLDPLPLARTVAIGAAGGHGGERVVLALKDLWPLVDEPGRQAIADAWGSPAAVDSGGRRELLWAAETQGGAPSIAAAHALLRIGGVGVGEATGVLTRAITTGPTKDRVYAISIAPMSDPAVRKSIRKAEEDPDEAVSLAAASRQLGYVPDGGEDGSERSATWKKERARLVAKLLKMASGKSTHALQARGALARAAAREVTATLVRDVDSKDERVREAAGDALATLGELPRASLLTADPQPTVRLAVACAILRAP